MKRLIIILTIVAAAVTAPAQRITKSHPDFESIKNATLDPTSRYYYPKLLKSFLSNDTVMTEDDYRYFYYGTMFQEDYNPYRADPFEGEAKRLSPLYSKTEHLTRNELNAIQELARKSLANNPLDLRQLNYLVYCYEKNKKTNLAKIWRNKFDHLLMTIARSGEGSSPESALVVVYPAHEFDYFNIPGGTVESTEYVEPYYERVVVRNPKGDKTETYYFDLHHLLEQYYLKHPEENK